MKQLKSIMSSYIPLLRYEKKVLWARKQKHIYNIAKSKQARKCLHWDQKSWASLGPFEALSVFHQQKDQVELMSSDIS